MTRRTHRAFLSLLSATALLYVTIESVPARTGMSGSTGSELDAIYADFDTLLTDLSEYAWPVDEKLSTTSVFADFRSTHFHAGVDVSTRGREGYEVRAMRDGYISRVRVASSGYGKGIEVTHADGFTTWYGHLQRYAPPIDSAVRKLQRSRGKYQVTLRPSRKMFPVNRGDLIAFTGSSGAGGAHVHFEIRDQNGNPVNPLLAESFGPLAMDNVAPVFEEVGFLPLKASTFVQADTRPFYLRPNRIGSSDYRLNTIVHVTGTVGLTVQVRDGVGRREYRNRGVSLSFHLDSVQLYSSDIVRIPTRESKQVALHYDWVARGKGKSHHQKLFLDEGNRLPFYKRRPYGSGILLTDGATRGYHTYTIIATDIHGNQSTLRGTLVFNHPPEVEVIPGMDEITIRSDDPSIERIILETSGAAKPGDGRSVFDADAVRIPSGDGWVVPYPPGAYEAVNVIAENEFGTQSAGYWIPSDVRKQSNSSLTVETTFYRDYAYVSVSSSLPVTGRPAIKVYSGPIEADLHVRSLGSRSFFSSFSLDVFGKHPIRIQASADINHTPGVEGFDEFSIFPVLRETGGTVLSSDGSFRMVFPPRGVFVDSYLHLERVKDEFEVKPDDVLLDRGATVEMDVPAALSGRRVGLFAQGESDLNLLDWNRPGETGALRGRVIRFLGSYLVLVDETGPAIGKISLRYGRDWLSGSFSVRDSRAGVDAYSLHVTVDGRMVIPEYETEQHIARLGEVLHLRPGRHVIEVSASDNMGNRSKRSAAFTTR